MFPKYQVEAIPRFLKEPTKIKNKLDNSPLLNPLTTSVPHHKEKKSIDLQCKSINWFQFDGEHWSFMG